MNILLTGGSGFIGSHAAVVLSQAGNEVILFDNFSNSNKSVIKQLKMILGKELISIEGDVRNTELLINVMLDYKIDTVIHFAGLKAVSESVNTPLEYYANNVEGTISLLEAMKKTNKKKLIFSSSATIYGNPQYLPLDENHPTSAINVYGRTKLNIEEMLRDVALSDNQWKIICLRYFNPIGAHESGLIGENPSGLPNNLMPYITQVAIRRLPYLNIFGGDYNTHDGTGVRDYIHVVDLAEGHLAALNYFKHQFNIDAFNLGTGKGTSVLELIACFESSTSYSIPFTIVPRRVGDIACIYTTASRAEKYLNWKARRTLKDMCESSMNYIKQVNSCKNN